MLFVWPTQNKSYHSCLVFLFQYDKYSDCYMIIYIDSFALYDGKSKNVSHFGTLGFLNRNGKKCQLI